MELRAERGHALITGGIGGLGTAMVRRLRAHGVRVVACDRNEAGAKAWFEALSPAERDGVDFHPLDVTRDEEVQALAGLLAREGIHVAFLVNNAGIQGPGRIHEFDTKTWNRVMRVNLEGTFQVTRAFSGAMRERGFGRIVNLASVIAYHPSGGQHPYAAAKAGITGLTRSTAMELAGRGITVNAIAPGYIEHAAIRELLGDRLDDVVATVPMRRPGHPDEIASTVEFLLSEGAAYMTGQTLHVNGGMYLPA